MYCNASNRRKPLLFNVLRHKLYSGGKKSLKNQEGSAQKKRYSKSEFIPLKGVLKRVPCKGVYLLKIR